MKSLILPRTSVVNMKFKKYDVYIGRAGKGLDGYFGNPFILTPDQSRVSVLIQFEKYFTDRLSVDAEFRRRVHELKGRILGCFCHPKLCHGHIIANYLDWEVP